MTRLVPAARLLAVCRITVSLPARCHHRFCPSTLTRLPCLHRCKHTCSWHISARAFSTTSVPPPADVTNSSSNAQRDDSILAETARLVSTSSPSSGPSPDAAVIYTSPFVSAVRRMKYFSLSSCVLSLVSAPLLLLLSSPSIPLSGRLAMCTAVAAFGVGTTLALTKFTQTYVIRVWSTGGDTLLMETLNVWARPRYRSVPVDGLRPLYNRLLSNVRALHNPPAEKPYSDYFFHADIVDDPLLKPFVEHSLPPPEEQPESTEQQAEAITAEQTPRAKQPAADTPIKTG